ncbi:stage II sporulation protein R [Bacillus shivajii]|uniref:stage II sporulation protein R n=1 Tax=Bacillus shivajii TaxID=1983719 RepID=UPI001CFAA53B|nr:stage II sporulation protein R [Bacillus shivajii]UCZ53034.1 stage II sporulation protein R [Bacillus shivajii]
MLLKRTQLYLMLCLTVLILSWEGNYLVPAQAANSEVIPEESIRLRILSNSNSPIDQTLKLNVRDAVNTQVTEWVQHFDEFEEAHEYIGQNIEKLEETIASELEKVGKNISFDVGLEETSFPTKRYGNRLYPEGQYEAVKITLGDGQGDNWWCVLFPPLCFLDFSNDEGKADQAEIEAAEEEEVEVKFFVVEVITNLWGKVTS